MSCEVDICVREYYILINIAVTFNKCMHAAGNIVLHSFPPTQIKMKKKVVWLCKTTGNSILKFNLSWLLYICKTQVLCT